MLLYGSAIGTIFTLLINICIRFAWGSWTSSIGSRKGRDNCFWWGFLLGLLGLIIVLCMSDYSSSEYYDSSSSGDNDWICPKCGKRNTMFYAMCECGLSRDEAKRLNEKKIQLQKMQVDEESQKDKEEAMQKLMNEKVSTEYGELTQPELTIVKMLQKSDYSLPEMLRMLPRSADLKLYKDSSQSLCDKNVIVLNEDSKYTLI